MAKQYELAIKTRLDVDGVRKGGKELEKEFSAMERLAQAHAKQMSRAFDSMPASMRRIFTDQARFAEQSYSAQSRAAQTSANEQLRIGKSTGAAREKLLEQSMKAEQRAQASMVSATQKSSRDKLRVMQQSEHEAERSTEAHVRKTNSILARIGAGIKTAQSVLRGNYGGDGGGGFLPGLSSISQVIQGLPVIGQLAGALVSPLTSAAEAGIKFNAFLETSRIAFTTLLGSSEKAEAQLKSLAAFADKTPFQFEDLISSTKQMLAFGFAAKDVEPTLTAIGDALSAVGNLSSESLEGVTRQLGQIISKGRLGAEEMESLADRGVPAWELLSKAIGKTIAETRKLSEQGRLRGRESVQAILAMIELDPRFKDAMSKQQGTLTQLISNAQDVQQRAYGLATEGLTTSIQKTLDAGLKQSDLVTSIAGSINVAITPVAGMISAAASGLLGGGLTSGVVEGIAAGKSRVKDAVADFALDGIIGTAKKFLGIESPSTVMAEMGMNSSEGFAIGMMAGNEQFVQPALDDLRERLEKLLKDPRVAAFFEAIRRAEGGAVDLIVGGKRSPFGTTKHPNIVGLTTSAGPSTAAGNYQITGSNWYGTKRNPGGLQQQLQLPDFSAHSQLLAALKLFMDRDNGAGVRALQAGDIATAMKIAAKDWTSTPGSNIGGGGQVSMQKWMGFYNQALSSGPGLKVDGASVGRSNPMPVMIIGGVESNGRRYVRQPGDISGGNEGRLNKLIYTDGGESANALEFMRQINGSKESFAALDRVIAATATDLAKLIGEGAPNFNRGINQQQQFDQFQLDKFPVPPEYGKALKAITDVAGAEGSFYDSVVRKSEDMGKKLKDVWKNISASISQIPGNAVDAFRSGGIKGALSSIRKDFTNLLFGLAKDYLQSSIYKLLHSDSSSSSTGGGGLFGAIGNTIKSLFGGGKSKTGSASTSTTGSSATSAVEQAATAAITNVLTGKDAASSGASIGGGGGFNLANAVRSFFGGGGGGGASGGGGYVGTPGYGGGFPSAAGGALNNNFAGGLLGPAIQNYIGGGGGPSFMAGASISAPQSITAQSNWLKDLVSATGGKGWSGANAAKGGLGAGGFGNLFQGIGFGKAPGSGGPLASMLPLLGLSFGAGIGGGSGLGGIIGGAGGLLAGVGAVAAPAFLSSGVFASGAALGGIGKFATGLFANPFIAAAGGALLVAAYFIGKSKKRKQEEKLRTQILTDSKAKINEIIKQVKSGRMDGDSAMAQAQSVRAEYLTQVGQLKDKKTRKIAEATVRELDYLINSVLQPAIQAQVKRKEIEAKLVPEFAGGVRSLVPFFGGRVPGNYDGRDDRLIRVSGNEAVINPQQIVRLGGQAALARAGVPGYAAGFRAGQVNTTTTNSEPATLILSVENITVDAQGIVFEGLKTSDNRKVIIKTVKSAYINKEL